MLIFTQGLGLFITKIRKSWFTSPSTIQLDGYGFQTSIGRIGNISISAFIGNHSLP